MRKANGAVSFDSTEVKFKLDQKTGEPTSLEAKKALEVHSTIEELMVFANSTVAEKIYKTFPSAAFLRRHAEPDPRKTEQLDEILTKLGVHTEIASTKADPIPPNKFSASLVNDKPHTLCGDR